jgi:hypothetical protein
VFSIPVFNHFPCAEARQSEHQNGKGTLEFVEVLELLLWQGFAQKTWEGQRKKLDRHYQYWHEQEHQHRAPVEKMFPWFFLHGSSTKVTPGKTATSDAPALVVTPSRSNQY